MTLQNRVLPTGDIVADPARGLFMGNRGILHDTNKQLGQARWRHQNWVCCALSFNGRKREVMRPGPYYTELFFLDDAVALAAGHRPCAECRRADYNAYRAAWRLVFGVTSSAPEMDRALHKARVESRTKRQVRFLADIGTLPGGTFILSDNVPHLVLNDRLLPYAPAAYGPPSAKPVAGPVTVLTPRPLVAILEAGYVPRLHSTAL